MIVGQILAGALTRQRRVALIYNDRPLTYRWLVRSVAATRRQLVDQGILGQRIVGQGRAGPGIVAVAVRRTPSAWVTCFALRSLGFTTLVPSSSEALRELRLPELEGVVTAIDERWSDLAEICRVRGLPLHVVDTAEEHGEAAPIAMAEPEGGHILTTSGTTGTPKYLLYDPSFELEFLKDWWSVVGLSRDSVYGLFDFPLWTGVGYRAPMATWLLGGAVVQSQERPYSELLRHLSMTRATAVPAMLASLLDAPAGSFPLNPHLHLAVTGGGLSYEMAERARARITPHLENRMGSTETRTAACTPIRSADDCVWHRALPTANVQVVDDVDRPVAPGVIGRLRISTAGGPTGYLDDDETSRAFFRNGFFYTGDFAVTRDDGRFALQGRATDVLNVAGHKLSPAPIEARLRGACGDKDVCLLTIPTDSGGDETLVLVVETDQPVDKVALGDALRREMPAFPQAAIFMAPHLPRTVTGKLLRPEIKALVMAARTPHA